MMFRKLPITGLNKFRRIIAACFAALIFLAGLPSLAAAFPDLETGSWYYNEVADSIGNGLFQGGNDGKFYPEKSINRAEFIIALARLCQVDVTKETGAPFKMSAINLTS